MRVGPGTELGVSIGPMINEPAIAKIRAHIDDAVSKGAEIITKPHDLPEGSQYTAPVVLTGATTAMRLASEETFRASRPALPLRDGRGGDCDRQRHALRPCRLFLH